MNAMQMKGEVVVITGSAAGVGRGITVALAERGARIAGLDIDAAGNRETARLLESLGSECLAIHCDIADKIQVQRAVQQVLDHFSRIDVLVNNAAVWEDSRLLAGTFESQTAEYERSMDTCAMGAYYCAAACVPAMIAGGGGNVINIITEHIDPAYHLKGMPALGYDCAKFALWRQVASWSDELSDHNVRVNGLAFGATDTPLLRRVAARIADVAMKPADIGQAVVNVLAHGESGPNGETWVFGATGTPRPESLVAIEAIGPGGKSA